jgi:hypothetical protein
MSPELFHDLIGLELILIDDRVWPDAVAQVQNTPG